MATLGALDSAEEILTRDQQFLIPVYARYPVVMERGNGCMLYDTTGKGYLDMVSGLGVNALGHAHPRMLNALVEQAARMVHLSPQYSNPHTSLLAERLCGMSEMSAAFFSTGGTEAIEGALKLARTHGRRVGGSHKYEIVALQGSYHGRSFGSMSVTGQEKYSADFGPNLPGIRFVERDNLESLRAAASDATCAILLEPMLGEGGVLSCSDEFLGEARRLADSYRALLIFDEIQCGLGRVGTWFAFEKSGVRPNVLVLGKPLGGGLPLSALLVTEPLVDSFGLGKHGSTLGGTPLACRLGLEFMSVMQDEDVLTNVAEAGDHLRRGLHQIARRFLSLVVEVRGAGLMWGMELNVPARPVVEAGLERGVLFNVVQGKVLRFLPPLILTGEQVDKALAVLESVMVDLFPQADTMRVARPVAESTAPLPG